ncbi:trypsin-like peptidase domain-containing protein [Candidatus Acetothermia bacterium]|nr:trypsin-like peptidase domain-containing protein [Candidatus Acetothermia bacterium]MBI3643471.1 trypsin-like peptidase domain-containing protein [Candidatus Acetothermia bacterium]
MNKKFRWNRWLYLVLLISAVVLFPQQARTQTDFGSLYNLISPPVVRIVSAGVGSGSGYIIQNQSADGNSQTGIVTACHVVFDAPLNFSDRAAPPLVTVTFAAWKPDITIKAAVVKCDAANDAALLQPVDEHGEVTTLGKFFSDLAIKTNDRSLTSYPHLYFGDSSKVKPLDSVFIIGYPGPYSELNSLLGHVSGLLPVPHVVSERGRVDRVAYLLIYDGDPDQPIEPNQILQIQTLPSLDLTGIADLAQNILASGHGLLLISTAQPLGTTLTGWDATSVKEKILQVQERPVRLDVSIFGASLIIGPRNGQTGSVSLLRTFFRVDAPVAPGQSGAPMMNLNGQVVGMIEWGVDGLPGASFANLVNSFRKSLFGE